MPAKSPRRPASARPTPAALERANRRLQLLADANQALVRATDEPTLLAELCRLAVDVGGYRMAWVGLAEPGPEQRLRPLAHAGLEQGYLEEGRLSWGEGTDPAATAIRTGRPAVIRDIGTDPAFTGRRRAALTRGYLSVIALPLLEDGRAFGVLKIFSAATDAFDAGETQLLGELAEDVAFGLRTLRTRAERDAAACTLAADLAARTAVEERITVLSRALDQCVEGVFLMADDRPAFLYVNESAAAALGWSREELTGGMSVLDIDPAMDEAAWAGLVAAQRATARLRVESAHVARDGRRIPIEITGSRFEHGGRIYNLAVTRDISERQAAEAGLRTSEEAYRTLAEHVPDLIMRWDTGLRRTYVNPAFVQALGVTGADLHGVIATGYRPDLQSANAAILGEIAAMVRGVLTSGQPTQHDFVVHTVAGPRVLSTQVVPERDAGGRVTSALGIARDITERKDAERSLRTLVDHSPDIILRFDRTGRYLYANEAFERIAGRSIQAHLGREFGTVTGYLAEEPWITLRAHLDAVLASGRLLETEVQIPSARGPLDLNLRLVPEPADDGTIQSVLVVARDISAQKQAEAALAESEELLRQAQKMEAVGRLAGGIAHDFNNILAVIEMQSSLLLEEGPADPELREGLEEMLGAARRAANLTRQLLTFSRRQVMQPFELDPRETLLGMTRLLQRVLGEDVTLQTRFADPLPHIHADPGMLEQVLMNLAINARDAMPDGGTLTVRLETADVPAERAGAHPGASPGPHVVLTVSDTGCGIPAESLPRIFEPFFTTKEVGKGSGLGLATVFGIAELHHGWVEVDSTVGVGTTFRVLFPAVAS